VPKFAKVVVCSPLLLRSSLELSFLYEKPMGITYLLWLQTLIQRFIRTNEERSTRELSDTKKEKREDRLQACKRSILLRILRATEVTTQNVPSGQ